MGAGALGGYFGGRLAQAGHEVWLIARGKHLQALKSDGLRIISPKGNLHIKQINSTDNPGDVGQADIVLFMVKNRDVETAARAVKPLIGAETMIVTCQNGVSAWKTLGAIVGENHVVPGVARIPGFISKPGTITHPAELDILLFGEIDGSNSRRCEVLFDVLSKCGTTPIISDNILHELWSKFCGQSALASLTTLTGLDIGPLRDNEVSARLFKDAIAEAYQVGRAVIHDLPIVVLENNWDFVMRLPENMHASMLDDLRQGKPLEHEYLSGEVVRLGKLHNIPTPIHSTLYAALKPISDRLALQSS